MIENICEQCGERNEPGAQFCVACQAFLPWYDTRETDLAAAGVDDATGSAPPEVAGGSGSAGSSGTANSADRADGADRAVSADPVAAAVPAVPIAAGAGAADKPVPPATATDPRPADPAAGPAAAVFGRAAADGVTEPSSSTTGGSGGGTPDVASLLQVVLEPTAVEVFPGGDPASIDVRVHNLSPIVDAYVVQVRRPPQWLQASSGEVRLLPSTNESTRLSIGIPAGTLVPAGRFTLTVTTRSVAHPEIFVDDLVELTVPAVDAPLGLQLEPSMVRVKDSAAGRLQATVDNRAGNQPRTVTLSGRDLEGVVRFTFTPAGLVLGPGEAASAQVRIEAPPPDAGQQATRQLTITAADGKSAVEGSATFVQVASVDTPLQVRLEPSLVRVRDTGTGMVEAVVDNRRGIRTRRVFLSGRDPERVVRFTFSPPSVDVLAGELVRVRVRLDAAAPEPGQEATRAVTVLATSDGTADIEATASFVQATSVVAPLSVELDPSVVRVRDSASGSFEVIVDNRGGSRIRRVFLTGRDPERAVRFTFSPPSIQVAPGDIGRARVTVEAAPPESGQESSRQVTVVASENGNADDKQVQATGTFVQATSAERPITLKLEPSLVRVRDSTSAPFGVIVDNRHGARLRRVTLAGSDPERAVGFSFWPPVVDVGPGQLVRVNGQLDAYPPEPGGEYTRQFSITASDGERDIEASGTFVQTSSPPPPDEPLILRLDPSIVRVRNSGSGALTVIADNRGGGRPRRAYFAGHDPERVVRFDFAPEFLDLAPGQVGSVRGRIWAPRPDGGQESTRPYSVVASDGERDVEAAGSFVQESSDRRPLWRIVLTLLGGLMMIGGALLAWHVEANIDIPADLGAQVGPNIRGLEWDLPALQEAFPQLASAAVPNLPDSLDPLASAGSVIILLAVIAMLGLTGPTGRLTRLAALLAAVLLAAFLIAVSLEPNTGGIGSGVYLVFAGCAVAFTGGLLARPR